VVLANYGAGVTPAGAEGAPPGWDNNFPSAKRFVVLAAFGNAAVLDKNTGLVWEKAPNGTPLIWNSALRYCLNKVVPENGGTGGWRLPSVVELKSVQDGSSTAPFVPASAFAISNSDSIPGVQSVFYWSATKCHSCNVGGATGEAAWGVRFNFDPDGLVVPSGIDNVFDHAWCVRGPMQESLY
jgi:hypothetical protein